MHTLKVASGPANAPPSRRRLPPESSVVRADIRGLARPRVARDAARVDARSSVDEARSCDENASKLVDRR
jgi:hypothetical protein